MNKIIFADNYFTSINLLEILKLNKTLACGTIRTNRKQFPKKFVEDKKCKEATVIIEFLILRYQFINGNIIESYT